MSYQFYVPTRTLFEIGFGGYGCLFPVLSVVDPELMVSVPPKFTAYQGFDELFHSTECYISKGMGSVPDGERSL